MSSGLEDDAGDEQVWQVKGERDVRTEQSPQARLASLFAWETIAAKDLFSSAVVSPRTLFTLRLVFAIWHSAVALYIGARFWETNGSGNPIIVTLPYLCYLLICLYFVLSVLTTMWKRTVFKQLQAYEYARMQRDPLGVWMRAVWVLFEIAAPMAFTVSALYWIVLAPREASHGDLGRWSAASIHLHILNSVVMFLELVLGRLRFVGTHVIFLLFICGGYLVLAVVWHGASHHWLYFFFDTSSRYSLAYYFGIPLGAVVIYFMASQLTAIREFMGLIEFRADFVSREERLGPAGTAPASSQQRGIPASPSDSASSAVLAAADKRTVVVWTKEQDG